MSAAGDSPILRTVRSFVVRTGRTTAAQREALERFLPLHGLRVEAGLLDPQLVFGRRAPLVLEIGFGMGETLAAMAAAAPECDFLGVEVHPPGVGNLLRLITERGLGNLKVYQADAKDVLERCIPAAALSRVQLYFPDPWPKKRHHKRRLVQADFATLLKSRLQAGGQVHLATDWEPYAGQMMAVFSAMPGWRNPFGVGAWAQDTPRLETKFERRGKQLGHGVWDLVFEKV